MEVLIVDGVVLRVERNEEQVDALEGDCTVGR